MAFYSSRTSPTTHRPGEPLFLSFIVLPTCRKRLSRNIKGLMFRITGDGLVEWSSFKGSMINPRAATM
jgi:hypothetical protein